MESGEVVEKLLEGMKSIVEKSLGKEGISSSQAPQPIQATGSNPKPSFCNMLNDVISCENCGSFNHDVYGCYNGNASYVGEMNNGYGYEHCNSIHGFSAWPNNGYDPNHVEMGSSPMFTMTPKLVVLAPMTKAIL